MYVMKKDGLNPQLYNGFIGGVPPPVPIQPPFQQIMIVPGAMHNQQQSTNYSAQKFSEA